MKGKLPNKKNLRPSLVFAAGVIVIMLLISYFVHLHVDSVERIEEINWAIEGINGKVVTYLSGNSNKSDIGIELIDEYKEFAGNPTLKYFYSLYPDIRPKTWSGHIESDKDVVNLYNLLAVVKDRIHDHSVAREKSFRTLYLLILVVIVTMFLFLGVSQFENYKLTVTEKKRNESNMKLYDQLEKERSLIAFELHDDIAQKLAVLKRYFNSKNSIDEHTNLMEHYTTDVIKRVRYLSRMLKAPDNPDVSFKDYLETLFSDFNVLSDYKLNRKTVGLNALQLDPTASLHIYRIIQEVLTNSRIHSEATEIDLLIVYSHPTLTIKYKDNGKGFDPYLVYRKGIGLDSIKYRLDLLKGEYRLNSAEGEGTDISIDIPVELCEIS